MTCHQYGISALVSQMSFCRETVGGVAKCRLFSQAAVTNVSGDPQLYTHLSVEVTVGNTVKGFETALLNLTQHVQILI